MARLKVRPGGRYVDATAGGGGHARAIAERMGPAGRLLALDQDETALARARARLEGTPGTCVFARANFAELEEVGLENGFVEVDGVLMDLGVSSDQLDEAERGFSFLRDGPLDMRMDRRRRRTAADLVNTLEESELRDLLRAGGEEREAGRIARAIVRARPLARTLELAEVVRRAKRTERGRRIDPATKTFQALRMAVNEELAALERGLEGALRLLRPGGRLLVISFHSLEDRLVKRCFLAHAGRWEALEAGGRRWVAAEPEVILVDRKPVTPSPEEVRENPRARSARMRTAQRKEGASHA